MNSRHPSPRREEGGVASRGPYATFEDLTRLMRLTRVSVEFREAIKNAQAQYLRHIGSENDAFDFYFCAQAQYLRHIGSESFAFDFNFCAQAQYLRHIGS